MAQARTTRGTALSYLTAIVTQGSNDAFAETSVPTGLGAVGNQAFQVRELLFRMPGLPNVNACRVGLSLTRKSFSAEPNVTERTLIWKAERYVTFTTSGALYQDLIVRVQFDENDNLLLVEDPIYLSIDSDTTSAANVGRVRIGYISLAISEVDRLTLINNTLSS